MDGLPYTVRVGGELAVTAHVQGEWATWKDLQDSSKLKELMRKSEELVARTSRGMKGGKASGKGSLPHYGFGHMGHSFTPKLGSAMQRHLTLAMLVVIAIHLHNFVVEIYMLIPVA